MNFSSFFVKRPIFAGVLSAIIFIAGAISLKLLPISEYPEVVPPTVVVRALYPGANPQVIAETVASPLEQAINGVEDMLYTSSQSTSDGVVTLTVTFALGTDLDKAQVLVQNRVSQTLPKLPEVTQRLGVITQKSSPDLTMVVHLISPDNGTTASISRTTQRCACATSSRASRAWARRGPWAPASTRCACGSTRTRSRRSNLTAATSCMRSASRTCRWPPASSVRRRRRTRPSFSS